LSKATVVPLNSDVDAEELERRSRGTFPGMVGLQVVRVEEGAVSMRLVLRPEHLAPNGFLHGAVVVAIADTACGYGTVAHLPQGATNFTTVELKTNYVGTVREGAIVCTATPVHMGRSTQVWDAVVHVEADDRRIALFRCTQLVLWPRS
jgi:uncharacterized protein (TIGR00369 family)